jgi:hypothetical protein
MVTQEMMTTIMAERAWEASRLRRQRQALAPVRRKAAPRSGPSTPPDGPVTLRSVVVRAFRMASGRTP